MTDSAWITANEAAEIAMLTPWQVYRHGVSGRIRIRRVKGQVLYLASDVERLADEVQLVRSAAGMGRDAADDLLISGLDGGNSLGSSSPDFKSGLAPGGPEGGHGLAASGLDDPVLRSAGSNGNGRERHYGGAGGNGLPRQHRDAASGTSLHERLHVAGGEPVAGAGAGARRSKGSDQPAALVLDLFKRSGAAMREIHASLNRQNAALREVGALMRASRRNLRLLLIVLLVMGLIALILLGITLLLLAHQAR